MKDATPFACLTAAAEYLPRIDRLNVRQGEIVRCELVIACRDPPTLFDLIEESLN
jgi:hypothetical protein